MARNFVHVAPADLRAEHGRRTINRGLFASALNRRHYRDRLQHFRQSVEIRIPGRAPTKYSKKVLICSIYCGQSSPNTPS